MSIITEDGTGLTDAQSYCDVDYFDSYLAERSIQNSYTTEQKESAIVIAAIDWIDGYHTFNSCKLVDTQALKFPTVENGLPDDIKLANAKAAYLQLRGLLLVDQSTLSTSGIIESEDKSLGALSKSVKYVAGSAQVYSRIIPRDLKNLLAPYLSSSNSLGWVTRG